MAYTTKNKFDTETHPWEPYFPENATKLILGTFPTAKRNRKTYEFFYPNPNNEFWKILFSIANVDFEKSSKKDPIEERKKVLKKLRLGIADMGKVVHRQRGNSSDANLFPVQFTDILALLEDHKNIKTLIVTSSTGSNSVLSWLHQYCDLNKHNFKIPKGTLPLSTSFQFNDKEIVIKIVPSPSGQWRTKSGERLQMYQDAIIK